MKEHGENDLPLPLKTACYDPGENPLLLLRCGYRWCPLPLEYAL